MRLDGGLDLHVRASALGRRRGPVAVGIRPEKIRIGGDEPNSLPATVVERAYVGVATQYVVETPAGRLTVYAQNSEPHAGTAAPGEHVTVGFSPDATFVVDRTEEERDG